MKRLKRTVKKARVVNRKSRSKRKALVIKTAPPRETAKIKTAVIPML